MKLNSTLPIYSDKPLCEETDWLAIPISLSCKSSSYASALSKIKEVSAKLETVGKQASSEQCKFIPLPSDDSDYHDLEPCIDLAKTNGDCIVCMKINVVIELNETLDYWKKMELIMSFVDEVHQYCDQFRNDNYLQITFGAVDDTLAG